MASSHGIQAEPRKIKNPGTIKSPAQNRILFHAGLIDLDEGFTWHRPIFSGSYPPNIVGATAFHNRVRDGSEWFHCAMDTRIELLTLTGAMASTMNQLKDKQLCFFILR